MVNYPTSLDTLTNPAASDQMDDAGVEHDVQHSDVNDAIEELEGKLGIGASYASGAGNLDVLQADGSGGTTWGQYTSPDGSASSPGLRFTGDTATGLYLVAAGDLGVAGDIRTDGAIYATGEDTGLTFPGLGSVRFFSQGTRVLDLNSAGIQFFAPESVDWFNLSGFDSPLIGLIHDGTENRLDLNLGSSEDTNAPVLPELNFFVGNEGVAYDARIAVSNAVTGTSSVGTASLTIDAAGLTVPTTFLPDGSEGSPSITFDSDQDTGLYRTTVSGAAVDDSLSWASAGTEAMRLDANGDLSLRFADARVLVGDGSVDAPAYAFLNDPDTGIWSNLAGELDITIGGVNRLAIQGNKLGITGIDVEMNTNQRIYTSTHEILFEREGTTDRLKLNSNDYVILQSGGVDRVSLHPNGRLYANDYGISHLYPGLANGWENYGGSYQDVSFFRDPNGFVHLRGLIRNGAPGTVAFSLPGGYRPTNNLIFTCMTGAGHGQRVNVDPDGAVTPTGADTDAYVDLSTIHFAAFD